MLKQSDVVLLTILAKRHADWIKMAKSLKSSSPEDTVQEMYLRMHKYVDDVNRICYHHEEPNTFYVYCVLRNIVTDEFKQRQKSIEVSAEDIRLTSDSLIHQEEYNHEFDEALQIAESEIDEWYWYDQKLFKIYFESGMSIRQLASETKISTRSIFNTLKNGKEKIKQRLREEGKL